MPCVTTFTGTSAEPLLNLLFPGGSQTVTIGGSVNLKLPDDALSGKTNQYCPKTPGNIDVEGLWYCS